MMLFPTDQKKYKDRDISFLTEHKTLTPIDISFALRFSEQVSSDQGLLFLSFLSLLLREGISSLTLQQNTITPSPKELSPEDFFQYFYALPKEIQEQLFVKNDHLLFFKPIFEEQQNLYNKLDILSKASPLLPEIPPTEAFTTLTDEQQNILKTAISSCLTFICGGPGTGKSFLATHILETLASAKDVQKIVVGTPTGKAASILKQNLSSSHKIAVKTIHNLVYEIQNNLIPHPDVILIDEGSMVTAGMLTSILKGIKGFKDSSNNILSSSLIIIGDPNQLPPIGIGSGKPLKAWIQKYPQHTFYLTKIKRTNDSFIQHLSSAILNKQPVSAQALPNLEEAIDRITQLFIENLSTKDTQKTPSDNLFCVLTPMRQGPWGSSSLNTIIAKKIKHSCPHLPIPIMITDSFPSLDLYNGDTGMLDPKSQKVFFSYRSPISLSSIPKYSFNYTLSIHKSQGSEFEDVLLIIPKGADRFDHSLIYTGVTRAKRSIKIWADPESWRTLLQGR